MKSILVLIFLASFNFALAKQVPIDTQASKINWTGEKLIPGDAHTGTVKVKKGTINLDKNNQLVGGTIVIDLTTIDVKDLSGKWKKKLEAHLASDDFFNTKVKDNQDASFKITKVEAGRSNVFTVTGNLTIRGKTNPETFELAVEKKGKTMLATGEISFNRTKYDVKYNSESGLLKKATSIPKDKVIKDQIKLSLNLQTQAL